MERELRITRAASGQIWVRFWEEGQGVVDVRALDPENPKPLVEAMKQWLPKFKEKKLCQ